MGFNAAAVVAFGFVLAQSQTQDCRQTPRTETPAPTTPAPTQPSGGTITTQDGARVQAEISLDLVAEAREENPSLHNRRDAEPWPAPQRDAAHS